MRGTDSAAGLPSLLALETSAATLSVALQVASKHFAEHIHAPRRQTELAMPTIGRLFEAAGISVADLDAIAFGRGPGSFTGIRVATAIAQGAGLASDVPLIPISSMACLAQGSLRQVAAEQVLVCLDARLGEVYYGLFANQNGTAVLQGDEQIGLPDAPPYPEGVFGIAGSGFTIEHPNLDRIQAAAVTAELIVEPNAVDLLHLANQAWSNNGAVAAEDAQPVYLRNRVVSR
jgi:tRNA threonylcarbamoyladenosine biosynthesis protein TsaB